MQLSETLSGCGSQGGQELFLTDHYDKYNLKRLKITMCSSLAAEKIAMVKC